MLNRCFPYQEPLQILSVFHLLLIKSSPRHKRANTLIRQGSRKKNNPCREGTSPPLSCDFLSRRRVGTSGRGGHISAGMRNNLSRWLMINRTRHVGGGTKWYCLPLGWLTYTFVTNAARVALAFIIQTFLARLLLTSVTVCAGYQMRGLCHRSFKEPKFIK